MFFLDRFGSNNNNNSVLAELTIYYNETRSYHNITKRIPLDSLAGSLTINPNTMIAYATNPTNNTVAIIDLLREKIVNYLLVGRYPWDLQVNLDTNLIYVSNRFNNTVSVLLNGLLT